jgi:hypothetical protein
MNSRIALSALLIVIAAMVVTSQRNGLLEKSKALETCWNTKISEAHSLLVLYRSCTTDNQRLVARTAAPEAKVITLNFSDVTDCLGSQARHLQHLVANLIDSDR